MLFVVSSSAQPATFSFNHVLAKIIFLNNDVEVNQLFLPPPFEYLMYYVTLLWVEVGQP
jgi:hypothetical protein